MQQSAPFLRFIVAGLLTRDFIILPNGKAVIDQPGGSLLFAGAGLRFWDEHVGLIGRINEDFPREWLDDFVQLGFDVRGIQIDPEYPDQRNFMAYPTIEQVTSDNPLAHFARIGKPFPKSLLGFSTGNIASANNHKSDRALRLREIPPDYADATAAHICAMDFASQTRLPSFFHQGNVITISLMAADEYMDPIHWDKIPLVVKGISAFICREDQVRNLFKGRSSDLWEMAEAIAVYGCEYIIIEQKNYRYLVYDQLSKMRLEVPTYPVQVVDPTGASDAFCGGFMAGLREFQKPDLAALKGSISASFTLEGSGPFYCLDALPALKQARLDAIQHMIVRK